MNFPRTWFLRGPNVWAGFPVLEVEVALGELTEKTSREVPGFADQLLAWLPTLVEHRCSVGERGGFVQRLREGTHFAHVLEHVLLELQTQAGTEVGFGRTRPTNQPGVYNVAVEYGEEAVAEAALDVANRIIAAAVNDTPFDPKVELPKLHRYYEDVRLGPSAEAIVRAARVRGIPVRRLNNKGLLQLGHAKKARRMLAAETDRTPAVAESIAYDRELVRGMLAAVGAIAPAGRAVQSGEDAWEAALDIGLPVVIKPRYASGAFASMLNLNAREEILAAYEKARQETSHILVEQFVPGNCYRLLVVNDRVIAATQHAPVRNVTGEFHSELMTQAVEAARVVGLDIAGVEIVCADVANPQAAFVLGVIANPGLQLHLQAEAEAARLRGAAGLPNAELPNEQQSAVASAIVAALFPEGDNGRVPVIGITGVNGKTTTTRIVAHLFRAAGQHVGMNCTDGLYIDDRRIDSRDCSGPRSARSILLNPRVEVAVCETARGGILREGLGYDVCMVGVVTNIGRGDHLGLRGIETLDDLARVKRTVIEAVSKDGWAVLNAADPLVAGMAAHTPGRVIFFAREADEPVLAAHRAAGGTCVYVRDELLMLEDGGVSETVAALVEIPATHGGRVGFMVENILAATAAAWGAGMPVETIAAGLRTFTGSAEQTPGRFNVLAARGATIIVDFAHNASALLALVGAIEQFPPGRRTLVFSAFNRPDGEVREMGEILGRAFDRVVLFQDRDNRDRADGELNSILRAGITATGRTVELRELADEAAAIETALADVQPGEIVVIGSEVIERSLELVRGTEICHPSPR